MLDFISEVKQLWDAYGAWVVIAILIFVEYKFRPLRKIYRALDIIAENSEHHKTLKENIDRIYTELSSQIESLRGFVVHELSYNGQSSTKDAVARTEQLVSRIAAQTHVGMELHPYGIFMCDFSGNNFFVNRTYAYLVGVTKEELLSAGWHNFVHDAKYDENYKAAFEDKRDFSMNTTLVPRDGEPINVRIIATVLQGLDGYMGYIIPEDDNNIHTNTQTKSKAPSTVSK